MPVAKQKAMKHLRRSVLRRHSRADLPSRQPKDEGRGRRARPIRLAIVSNQRLIREALTVLLSVEEGIDMVGEAPLKPNVVLVDMPTGREGIELLRTIQRKSPDAKLLALTAAADEALIFEVLKAGAKGFVSKNARVSHLRKAIWGVHEGKVWVERNAVRCLGERPPAPVGGQGASERSKSALTTREQEVLRLLASGGTNKEIAKALLISENTVKTHLSNIFLKLQVTRRLQAVLCALRQGLR